MKNGYQFRADADQLQTSEIAVIRGSSPRSAGSSPAPSPRTLPLQPKGRWTKHLNTQLSSVESTLDVIADYTNA